MVVKSTDLKVLNDKSLTNSIIFVKKDLAKYWDKVFINDRINLISNYKHKIFVKFLWFSGLRVSEAVGLRKRDFSFDNFSVRIRWLKSRKYKERVIPLHPVIRDLMQLYVANLNLDDRVFPFSRQNAFYIVKRYLGGSPHQLRHSFAVNWLRNGCDIVSLHRYLGHSRIQTTMEYLKIVPVDLGKELIKIDFG